LTGGIASGKTTVARFLEICGAFVVDADRVVHSLLEPDGDAFAPVVDRFGGILDRSGRIDRALLANRVFDDDARRADLESIVHPLVRAEADRRFNACAASGLARVAVFDAALLVETGSYRDLDRLIVVHCSRRSQVRRLIQRGDLTAEDALARVAAQASVEEKLAVADYEIDTDEPLDVTRRRTEEVYLGLVADWERQYG